MSARWAAAPGSSGQALTELAVLGSLLLLLLGWMINNALGYDYRQQATMEAFRRGLASAAGSTTPGNPISTSHLLIQDRHVPNPSDPFAVGSLVSVSAQGGVTRSYLTSEVPLADTALPSLAIHIENSDHPDCPNETCSYRVSGFRTERGVPEASLDRYHVIYGASTVCDKPECGGDKGGRCLEEVTEVNPNTQQEETVCLQYSQLTLRILDACEGQIIDHDACTAQAAQIVNSEACGVECQKTGGKPCDEECKQPDSEACRECRKIANRTASKCQEICSQPMNIPAYAAGTTFSGGRWVAPYLDDVLFAGIERMGAQSGATQVLETDNELRKQESPSEIVSTTRIGLKETTTRDIITRESPPGNPRAVTATRHEESTTTWNAPW